MGLLLAIFVSVENTHGHGIPHPNEGVFIMVFFSVGKTDSFIHGQFTSRDSPPQIWFWKAKNPKLFHTHFEPPSFPSHKHHPHPSFHPPQKKNRIGHPKFCFLAGKTKNKNGRRKKSCCLLQFAETRHIEAIPVGQDRFFVSWEAGGIFSATEGIRSYL